MTKPIRIIQMSHPGSGSTVLSNLLMAFLQPYENIIFMGKYFYKEELVHNNIVIKTHDKSIDEWNKKFQDIYDLYYIISDRHDYDWSDYKNNQKFLFISYEELL